MFDLFRYLKKNETDPKHFTYLISISTVIVRSTVHRKTSTKYRDAFDRLRIRLNSILFVKQM